MTMFTFLSPWWLAGLASLTLPLALHLWSRRTGRAVRVGSIRLLGGAPPPMARRPRLHDPLLLALRCALLTALVLALARPAWIARRATPVWALVATNIAGRAGLVDSLERSGSTVHPLDPGDVWMSLAIADQAAPPGTRFEVYATSLLDGVRGTRPALHARVTWHTRPLAHDQAPPAPPSPARIVAVFADASRSDDARYVAAAIRAVGIASPIAAVVTTRAAATADAGVVASADWIVWLSDQPLADAVRQRLVAGATVLTDAGRITTAQSRTAFERNGPLPVWTDATGAPLLTVTREGHGLRYRFGTRFAPAWSGFVLDPAFPEALARLWLGSDSTRYGRDGRPIALSQVIPTYDPQGSAAQPDAGARSLFFPLWLISVGLFLVERRIVMRSAGR